MKRALVSLLCAGLATGCTGDSTSGDDEGPGGSASVTLAGTTFAVSDVRFTHALGEDGYFRFEGNDAAHADEDCLPGLGGGLALYGELPETVRSLEDLEGMELPFEFTGDGDDFNLCFVGSNGLLGVEEGTVRFGRLEERTLPFSFTGRFAHYDGEGGRAPADVTASGSGSASVTP